MTVYTRVIARFRKWRDEERLFDEKSRAYVKAQEQYQQ